MVSYKGAALHKTFKGHMMGVKGTHLATSSGDC